MISLGARIGKKVKFTPKKKSLKCISPNLFGIESPNILENQKYKPPNNPKTAPMDNT
jgi:hypothetical protein